MKDNMADPISFYQQQLVLHQERLAKVKKQLFISSMLRLAIFALLLIALYWSFGNAKLVMAVIILGVALFLFLVSRHDRLQFSSEKCKALIRINTTEIKVQQRKFHHQPEGNSYKNPAHFFSADIDLFGRGSLYQYLNRTSLQEGSDTLAALLTENSTENVLQKQDAIKDLASMPQWRQEFSALASMVKTSAKTKTAVQWLKNYVPFVPAFMRWLPIVFSLFSVGAFVLYFLDIVPESVLVFWLVSGLGITSFYGNKIKRIGANASKVEGVFEQYNRLMHLVEYRDFTSEILIGLQKQLQGNEVLTSSITDGFSKLLHRLDKNNNLLYLIFANGFFLRSMTHCFFIEKWIAQYGTSVEKWFETINFFDAYSSLGNFAFNHPKYTFPEITDKPMVLQAWQAGHPLLAPDKSVLNDIKIAKAQFFIVTGANMAGKSTFLRTISLQIVMANVGLPVCAQKMIYNPIKLITSMRTTDSLTDEESYFFSELKRLRFMVDALQTETYFVVLDEILKGTNSTDKAIGSRKFVERLVASKATGIIATHDLSLCEAAQQMDQLQNYYFDAEIINNELHFDYTFKKGICQNMNASFLLKKMGIVE